MNGWLELLRIGNFADGRRVAQGVDGRRLRSLVSHKEAQLVAGDSFRLGCPGHLDWLAGLLACWRRGCAPRVMKDGLLISTVPDFGPAFTSNQNGSMDPDAPALSLGEGGSLSFADLAAAMLQLEQSFGAQASAMPRYGIGGIQGLSDLLVRVLWPFCAGAPLEVMPAGSAETLLAQLAGQAAVVAIPGSRYGDLPTAPDIADHVRLSTLLLALEEPEPDTVRPVWGRPPLPVISFDEAQGAFLIPKHERSRLPHILDEEVAEAQVRLTLRVPEDLFYFDGHFDQAPVVAGVCQIHWVKAFVKRYFGQARNLGSLEAVKFHRLLLPGQEFTMAIKHDAKKGKFAYTVMRGQERIATGRLAPLQ